jgi:hypothetical protein
VGPADQKQDSAWGASVLDGEVQAVLLGYLHGSSGPFLAARPSNGDKMNGNFDLRGLFGKKPESNSRTNHKITLMELGRMQIKYASLEKARRTFSELGDSLMTSEISEVLEATSKK